MNKVTEFLRHNQGMIAGLIVCALLVVWGVGCQPKVTNPFNPAEKVTRQELKVEADAYAAKLQLASDDLDRQDAIRAAILEAGLAIAQGGDISPLGLASTLGGIMGIGLLFDNRKKDSVIASKNNAIAQFADALKKQSDEEVS